MNFATFKAKVYQQLQENAASPARYTDDDVAFFGTQAVRDLINRVGRYTGRAALNMVQSQQEYVLPVGILRLTKIEIIPESGESSNIRPLDKVALWEIPIGSGTEGDPTKYAYENSDPANPAQMSLFVYPAPGRNAANAIVYDYERGEEVTNNDAFIMPFKEEFSYGVILKTAGLMLDVSDDGDELQKAAILEVKGNSIIAQNSYTGGIFDEPIDRKSFP